MYMQIVKWSYCIVLYEARDTKGSIQSQVSKTNLQHHVKKKKDKTCTRTLNTTCKSMELHDPNQY